MKRFFKYFKNALLVSIAMFAICGFAYPMIMTGISQIIFPHQANGSLIEENGEVVGSSLVGQDFTDERLFHCRPSAYNYNTYTEEDKENGNYGGVSSGSNEDIEKFLQENPTMEKEDIPSDIITASGSGLDPHISVEAANVQIDRVSENTGLTKKQLKKMIEENTEGKFLGIFGEEKVNVLELNLSLAKEISMV